MSSYSADYSRFDNIGDLDDETDVMDKYHATGETVEVDALDVTGLPAELGGALKACTTRPTRPKNRAFLFIKPKAATPAMEKLVEATLASRGIKVLKKGTIDGPTIDKKRLIDQHYYAIASKATLLKPSELPVPEDKFESFFGVSFQDALKAGTAVNALQACEELKCTPDELRAEWRAVCASNDMIKFGGGFYCGKIKGYQVFNPFFMAMRSVYTTKDAKLVYFDVEFDPALLPWAQFRGEVLGHTDPLKAPAGSLRRLALEQWKELGLEFKPDTTENAVHASASPFEGLAERMNWLEADPVEDSFGGALVRAGVPLSTLRKWSNDPRVALGDGARGSLFDAFEDLDCRNCIDRAVALEQVDAFGKATPTDPADVAATKRMMTRQAQAKAAAKTAAKAETEEIQGLVDELAKLEKCVDAA